MSRRVQLGQRTVISSSSRLAARVTRPNLGPFSRHPCKKPVWLRLLRLLLVAVAAPVFRVMSWKLCNKNFVKGCQHDSSGMGIQKQLYNYCNRNGIETRCFVLLFFFGCLGQSVSFFDLPTWYMQVKSVVHTDLFCYNVVIVVDMGIITRLHVGKLA